MTLQVQPYSRFVTTPTVVQNGEEVWGSWDRPNSLRGKLDASQQIAISVSSDRAGRPDLISLDLYGTTQLDWLLIAFNDALEAFNWPRAGVVIKAPVRDLVLGEVI